MSDQEKNQGLLWMFRYDAKGATPREVEFDPSDPIYHLYRQTRNPFLERAIAPSARKLQRTPEELGRLVRFVQQFENYRVAPSNEEVPYRRRSLEHPPPPPVLEPSYVTPDKLTADLTRLPWMIDVFFRAVMSRLHADPFRFKQVVEDLLAQFREEKVTIKIYESYRTLRGWEDLMDTLEEIMRYPSPETFDLFCSALFAYYDLVYPPAGA